MLIGEQPEVRPLPVHAIVLPAPEAIVRKPQQRRRYILRQDVARYGSTPGCEACAALAGGAQRVTKPHSDECRTLMDGWRASVCIRLDQQQTFLSWTRKNGKKMTTIIKEICSIQ